MPDLDAKKAMYSALYGGFMPVDYSALELRIMKHLGIVPGESLDMQTVRFEGAPVPEHEALLSPEQLNLQLNAIASKIVAGSHGSHCIATEIKLQSPTMSPTGRTWKPHTIQWKTLKSVYPAASVPVIAQPKATAVQMEVRDGRIYVRPNGHVSHPVLRWLCEEKGAFVHGTGRVSFPVTRFHDACTVIKDVFPATVIPYLSLAPVVAAALAAKTSTAVCKIRRVSWYAFRLDVEPEHGFGTAIRSLPVELRWVEANTHFISGPALNTARLYAEKFFGKDNVELLDGA